MSWLEAAIAAFTRRGDSGATIVEFAVTLPILIVIVVGIVDYAQPVNISTKLYSAARAGAQYAIKYPSDAAGIQSAAQSGTSDSAMSVTVNQFCTCGSSSATPVFSWGPKTQSGTCTSGTLSCASGQSLRYYVSITTSQTYQPLISYVGLGGSMTMTGLAIVQVE